MERICLACGGEQINSLEALSPEALGYADSVEETSLGEEVYTFVEGVKNPFSCTILVKGAHKHVIAQIQEAVRDGTRAVANALADGKFCICWDPLDGSSIVDNNWAVGTILGIWPESTGILGATGRDQVASMVALYGPRTTVFVTLDDGVYEFTYGATGIDGWICSRDKIEIAQESKIFAPANMRAAQDLPAYDKLIKHWMTNRYTLRYTGGLVPDICQQFTKRQGVFANPTSESSPAKLRLAFEAAPFGLLVEKAGGKTSNGIDGASILDTTITGIDQRTPLCIGSAKEVDRFNEMVIKK